MARKFLSNLPSSAATPLTRSQIDAIIRAVLDPCLSGMTDNRKRIAFYWDIGAMLIPEDFPALMAHRQLDETTYICSVSHIAIIKWLQKHGYIDWTMQQVSFAAGQKHTLYKERKFDAEAFIGNLDRDYD